MRFYLLDHLIDINSKVKEQQGRMDAVRDEATRIFESFGEIETQILLDRQQSDTVLIKFRASGANLRRPKGVQQRRGRTLLILRKMSFWEPLPLATLPMRN